MSQPLSYTIRPMEPGDVPMVVAIERLSFPTPWLASSFLYELNRSRQSYYHVLLKPETGVTVPLWRRCRRWLQGTVGLPGKRQVIGYVGFRFRSTEAHISTIAVHPDWRGRGLGELLLLTALERSLELGANVVSLEVRASNQVAQNLYRKYGFQFTSVHRGYYRDGEDAWLMGVEVYRDAYQDQLVRLRQILEARLGRHWTGGGQNDGDTL